MAQECFPIAHPADHDKITGAVLKQLFGPAEGGFRLFQHGGSPLRFSQNAPGSCLNVMDCTRSVAVCGQSLGQGLRRHGLFHCRMYIRRAGLERPIDQPFTDASRLKPAAVLHYEALPSR